MICQRKFQINLIAHFFIVIYLLMYIQPYALSLSLSPPPLPPPLSYYYFSFYFSLPLFFFIRSQYMCIAGTAYALLYITSFSWIYTKIQEVHDSQSFACRIQLQLITFAMTFVGANAAPARFALALSISIPRFYPAWAGVSVSVLHFSGKWESIWRTLLRNCSWQHALCLYVPERHRVIPLVSHSGGSTPRAFLSPSRSPKRALFHCPRNIFTAACAMCRYSLIFFSCLLSAIGEFRLPDEKRFVMHRFAKRIKKIVESITEDLHIKQY